INHPICSSSDPEFIRPLHRGSDVAPMKVMEDTMRMVAVLRSTARSFTVDECSMRAAALAYYAVFSLPSALVIVIYVAGLMYGRAAAAGQISSKLESFVGPQAGSQIQAMISNAGQHRGSGLLAGLIALAALIIASTTAVSQLRETLNRVWSV